jgi:competence protein ComEC
VTDGRLLLPASAAWAAATVVTVALRAIPGLASRHDAAGLVVAVVLVLSLVLALLAWSRRVPWAAIVVAAGLLIGLGSAAVHAAALAAPAVTDWISARATATVVGVITTEPIVRSGSPTAAWYSAPRREVRMATSAVAARGGMVAVDLPMLMRLTGSGTVPPPGTLVRVVGRLSPPPPGVDVAAVLATDGTGDHLTVIRGPGWVDRMAQSMRVGLRTSLAGAAPEAGSLVAGLAIGDESGQPLELQQQMQASGLSHLTAVSGGNVAIVVVSVVALAAALRLGLVARVVAAMLALAFFVILVGPAPSVVRAAVMGGLALIGLLTGGRRAGPSVLAAAVLILVVLAPALTASWGFALSAGATAGVVMLAPVIADRLAWWPPTARWPPGLRAALGVTGAAQIATLPILVSMGASVGWVSLPANLLAMPVVAPITVLGLLSAMSAPMSPALGGVLAHLAVWPAGWIAWVARTASSAPGARLPLPAGVSGLMLLGGIAVAGWGIRAALRRLYPRGIPRLVSAGLVGVAVISVTGWTFFPPDRRGWPPEGWLMIMCDVGQGDGLLVRSGEHAAMVVDAGPDPDRMAACLDDAAIREVPAVVLTHFHADHVGGLAGVFRGRSVGAVFDNPVRDPPGEAASVDYLLADEGIDPIAISSGDVRTVANVTWRAIWPRRVIHAGSVPNNASIVLVVDASGHRLLLLGDVEPEAQAALAADLVGQRYDVVKIPHHGSQYQDPNLTAWAPAPIALISVGLGNDYGHPSDDTIRAWRSIGALVARTDVSGDVAVVTSGSGLDVVARHGMLPSS